MHDGKRDDAVIDDGLAELLSGINSQIALFDILQRESSDVFWLMDMQLKTIYMSPSVVKNLGYTVEEYTSLSLEERLPPESFRLMQKILMNDLLPVIKGEKPDTGNPLVYEMLHKHKNGHMVWGEISINLIRGKSGGFIAILGITRNIDERKRAQIALEESRKKYLTLVENSPDWVWEVDEDLKLTYINSRPAEVFGIPVEFVLGKTPFEFSDPSTVENEMTRFNNKLHSRLPFAGYLQVLRDKNGRKVYLEVSGNPVFDSEGIFRGYQGVGRDITERQMAARKIERFERSRHFMLSVEDYAFMVLDENLEIIEWSIGASGIFGYDRSDAMSDKIFPLLWEPERRKAISATFKRNVKLAGVRYFEAENLRKDGRLVRCKWAIDNWFESDGSFAGAYAAVSIVSGVTDLKLKADGLNALLLQEGIQAFFTNPKMRLTYASASISETFGKSPEQMKGTDAASLFDKSSFEDITNQGVLFAKKNRKWSDEVTLVSESKSYFSRKLVLSGHFDKNNKLIGYIFLFTPAKR